MYEFKAAVGRDQIGDDSASDAVPQAAVEYLSTDLTGGAVL